MFQNMSLGSNGVHWVCSLRKIPMRLYGTNLCINCTSSTSFAPSFMYFRNIEKSNKTLRNSPIHEFRIQWGGLGVFIAKNFDAISCHELLHLLHQFNPFCTEFYAVTKENPKCTHTVRTHGEDRVCSLQKIPM